MGVLKLESFAHDSEIQKGISRFDSFEALRDHAFNEGVKSGADAATRAFEAEKLRTLSPILEALNDMAFSQQEARQALLNSLHPLFKELVKAVLPDCASRGLASEIAAAIYKACEKSPLSQIQVHVAPDAVSAIEKSLSTSQADVQFLPDAALGTLEARISWQGGFDEISLSAALTEIEDVVESFFESSQNIGALNA